MNPIGYFDADPDMGPTIEFSATKDRGDAKPMYEHPHDASKYIDAVHQIAQIECYRGMDGAEAIERLLAAVGYARSAL